MRILLVEDDFNVRELIADMLQSFGHRVVETASATYALTLLQSGSVRPDLVVSDVRVPGMRIQPFIEAIQKLEPPPKILLVTGWDKPDIEVPCLHKPFTTDALRYAVISAYLGEPVTASNDVLP